MKKKLTVLILGSLLLVGIFFSGKALLTGPANTMRKKTPDSTLQTPITFTDALGHQVTVDKAGTVVSLMGSFAELWLLAGGTLAGVTDDAYTERALALPADVELLGSYKNPSVEKIISLDPDLVILSADTSEHVALYETKL